MKIGVLILVLFGILAAGAAAVLVRTTSFMNTKREVPMLDVLVAVSDLPARSALTEASVEVRKMTAAGLPRDVLSNWSQAAGKTLKMAVVAGQPLASSQFIPKNSIDDLLRPGMLAFPAPLSTRNTAVNLLYPGCIVDVFATFPLRDREKGDAVVTPLLQNIQVLAIADDTVIPAANEKEAAAKLAKKGSASRSTGNVTVTLEVSARQAAALQLAMEKGTLGLAMRNPNDKGWNPMEPMVVKEGQLTASSEALDPQTLAWVTSIQRMLNPQMGPDPNAVKAMMAAQPAPDPNRMLDALKVQPQEIPAAMQPKPKARVVEVIRARDVTDVEVEGQKDAGGEKEGEEASAEQEAVKEPAGS
jgi:Flp pilus assembly protein CpaB